MREVIVSGHLWDKIEEVNDYLIDELKLSEEATEKRIRRMERFVMNFAKSVNHAPCRFKNGVCSAIIAPYLKRNGFLRMKSSTKA